MGNTKLCAAEPRHVSVEKISLVYINWKLVALVKRPIHLFRLTLLGSQLAGPKSVYSGRCVSKTTLTAGQYTPRTPKLEYETAWVTHEQTDTLTWSPTGAWHGDFAQIIFILRKTNDARKKSSVIKLQSN